MSEEYLVTAEPMMEPVHPGQMLKEDILPALGLAVSEVARLLKVSRQTLHRILSGNVAITPEMALRLGKFCGNGPVLGLRMQEAYDLWHARQRLQAEIDTIPVQRMAEEGIPH
jgi:addiction module HigA family antidote